MVALLHVVLERLLAVGLLHIAPERLLAVVHHTVHGSGAVIAAPMALEALAQPVLAETLAQVALARASSCGGQLPGYHMDLPMMPSHHMDPL